MSTDCKFEAVGQGASKAANPSSQPLFPFVDLKAQFASIREEVMAAIARVMESQQFILGNEVDAFEKEMARQLEVKEVVSCASGTAALEIALQSLRIGPGDEVITTPYTFVATAGAIATVSARPVFVDIDPATFNLDASALDAAITGKTRAIIPVHLFGLPAEMDAIVKVAAMHNLAVIEDAAQAIGASYRDARVGGIGTLGCFSFFPSKNLGGAGDGGMVTTNDSALANRLRLIRTHGSGKKYHYETLGVNSRLDALQAAILRVKLPHLPEWTRRRQEIAARYQEMFARQNLEKILTLPAGARDRNHVFNQYVIRCPKRDSLREHLRERGIPTEVYYPAPLHLQPAFAYLGYREGAFPQAEAASRETLALPIYPELSAENQAVVVREIKNFFKSPQ
ncbi:MAG TPA: DegT/DnrJ/EryC1/StrS family aminotransferase [Terriglobia bacterium]|nr:DegT/DnrJ/EryC1/StrS family aminotransferase [Terriglobia bacterium]